MKPFPEPELKRRWFAGVRTKEVSLLFHDSPTVCIRQSFARLSGEESEEEDHPTQPPHFKCSMEKLPWFPNSVSAFAGISNDLKGV